jgi:hypothetical protein
MVRVFFSILFLAFSCASQTPTLSWGDGCLPGLWLTLPTELNRWTLSWSTDLVTWTPYLQKLDPGGVKTISLLIQTNDARQFWSVSPLVSLPTNFVSPVFRPPLP